MNIYSIGGYLAVFSFVVLFVDWTRSTGYGQDEGSQMTLFFIVFVAISYIFSWITFSIWAGVLAGEILDKYKGAE